MVVVLNALRSWWTTSIERMLHCAEDGIAPRLWATAPRGEGHGVGHAPPRAGAAEPTA